MGRVTRTRNAAFTRALADIDQHQCKVGFFESAHYPDGTPVANVAAIQEYGTVAGNIPPRPFMRPTIDQQKEAWSELFKKGAKLIFKGRLTTVQVLNGLGMVASGNCRETIASITEPELSDRTIEARRAKMTRGGTLSVKPLVDTRVMITHLTYTIDDDTRD